MEDVFKGLEDQRSLQKRPNRPNTNDPGQYSRSKAKHKTQRSGSRRVQLGRKHHGLTVLFTTGHVGCHSQPVVTPVSPDFSVLLRGFSVFHAVFIRLCCKFIFEGGCIWTHLFHSSTILIPPFSIIFRVRLD